jgi:chemotaxis protein MotB
MLKRVLPEDGLNPYLALSDLAINVVFVFVFFVAAILMAGQISKEREEIRYKNAQGAVSAAVSAAPLTVKPLVLAQTLRNDPPGVQRWVFAARSTRGTPLFTSSRSAELTQNGRKNLAAFAQVLRREQQRWRRIRIEGHTLPPRINERESWDLSSRRAAVVADLFTNEGRIAPNYLAVAARGGQTLFNGLRGRPDDLANDRVEIVIEYAER